ncbi:MAG: hypothetical protein KatS3mg101_0516 [Patescibacteria group bacterium]|nr:MAG: hypothetical protein KatS3mg101_0516 [Patescibacteria group bacterium]
MTRGRRVTILGVEVDMDYSIEDVMEKIEKVFLSEGNHYICTTNPEFIMAAQKDSFFKNYDKQCRYVFGRRFRCGNGRLLH